MTTEIMEVISNNNNLIYSIIYKYKNYYDIEDLYQVAVIGLIKAYNNFKDDLNTKFSTYAYSYIFGEVNKYVNDYKQIKLSKDYLHLNKRINEAKNILTQKFMREPSNYELALFLEVDENLINSIDTLTKNIDSLDKIISSDEKDLYLYDVIPSNNSDQFNNIFLHQELEKLSDNERRLLEYRYFLDKTQQEISNCLGINQVQVSRYEKKILKKIRQNMEI